MKTLTAQHDADRIAFRRRDFKGSRFRCLLATSVPRNEAVAWINSLVQPLAEVGLQHRHMPRGFRCPDEAQFSETDGLLDATLCRTLKEWWLAKPDNATLPNWDLVSTCAVGGASGLVLLEAKAHAGELKTKDCCGAKDSENLESIVRAVSQASAALGQDWSLSANRCYQLGKPLRLGVETGQSWNPCSIGLPGLPRRKRDGKAVP
jgi:hypothetical protein